MSVPPPPQHPPPRRKPPQDSEEESLTTQLYVGGGGDSTQMLSMDELRQIAAESHVDSIDGPREGPGGQAQGSERRVGAHDEAYANEQAPPQVFSARPQSVQAPAAQQAPVYEGQPGHPHTAYPPQPGYAAPQPGYAPAAGQVAYGGAGGPAPGAGAGGPAPGQAQQPRKRRMPVLAIVFIVVAALVVMGIGGWITYDLLTREDSSSESLPAPPAPVESDEDDDAIVEDETEGPAEQDVESFTMPSGNIGCTIDDERARCVVQEWDYEPPDPPESCDMEEWGSIVVANHEGAGFSCTPAEFPSDASPLEYGESVTAHGMRCESSEEGVRCESEESGAGFSIARADASFDQG